VLELIAAGAGVALGAGLGWLIARSHQRAEAARDREALGARLAAAEALADELRKQLTQRELDLGDLRGTLDTERGLRAQAEARWEAARPSVEEQRRLLEDARQRLGESFEALSAEVLRKSGAALIEQARQTIDVQFGHRQEAIDALVKPLRQALDRYEIELRALEAKREHAYGTLAQHLQTLSQTSSDLQREAGNLVTALRGGQVRGRWGELTLRRIVELAGMVEYCDFDEQPVAQREGGRVRPDMVVRLSTARAVVVDAKVPMSAYWDAMNAATPKERSEALDRHARHVRQHMTALASKGYWEEFGPATELVVMFLPGEAFFAAAVHADPSLFEDSLGGAVMIATPTTLIALLRAFAVGWQQQRLAENAERISELGRQLYDRLRTMGKHFDDVGKGLKRATDAFNQAVGSMQTRVLPAARRFRDLGAAAGGEIPPLEPVDEQARELTAPEFPQQLDAPGLAP
jgi:DNA recombination protein RmuC